MDLRVQVPPPVPEKGHSEWGALLFNIGRIVVTIIPLLELPVLLRLFPREADDRSGGCDPYLSGIMSQQFFKIGF